MPPDQITGRLAAIPMPVDIDGKGPAAPKDTHCIYWQLWDEACYSVAECQDEEIAKALADAYNTHWKLRQDGGQQEHGEEQATESTG